MRKTAIEILDTLIAARKREYEGANADEQPRISRDIQAMERTRRILLDIRHKRNHADVHTLSGIPSARYFN